VTISSFNAMIRSTGPRTAKKTSAGRYCSLRAARNTTCRAGHHDEQADQRKQQRWVDQIDTVPGGGRRDQRGDRRCHDRQMEGDIGDRAAVTAGERHRFGGSGLKRRLAGSSSPVMTASVRTSDDEVHFSA